LMQWWLHSTKLKMADNEIQITVDGEPVAASREETLLSICRRIGKDIPTLCHHDALSPYAACRVCLVEVSGGSQEGLVPSCQYPASDGLIVKTDSKTVRDARRVVLELLLARCPTNDQVRDLAKRYGVEGTPYPSDDPEQSCILCGLCVRACEELVGAAAIGFTLRGIDRQVGTPFDESSEACIGCQACASVCPTGHVLTMDRGNIRRMVTWKTDLEMAECEVCGKPFAPIKQLDYVREKLPEHVPLIRLCPSCLRSRTVDRLATILELFQNGHHSFKKRAATR
jgi:bidirectional [NiFe] hydrogenase diaphorase subunit